MICVYDCMAHVTKCWRRTYNVHGFVNVPFYYFILKNLPYNAFINHFSKSKRFAKICCKERKYKVRDMRWNIVRHTALLLGFWKRVVWTKAHTLPLCHSACSFRALILLMTINKGRGSFLISGYVSLLWYDGFLYLGLRLWKYENIFAKNDILNQTSIISRDGKVFFLSIAKCNVYTHCCHFKFVKQNST